MCAQVLVDEGGCVVLAAIVYQDDFLNERCILGICFEALYALVDERCGFVGGNNK